MYVWDIPRYSPTEAGRLVGLRPDRVRRWLAGYQYKYARAGSQTAKTVRQAPVLSRGEGADPKYASFLDLVDLLFVKSFLEEGFSLQRIRKALEEAESVIGGHHFAQRCYFTDGAEIYLRVKEQRSEESDALLQLLSGGQWVIADVIKQVARQVDFDRETGFAEKWFPPEGEGRIVLDPRIAFGAPTVLGKGVRTASIFDLYVAEGEESSRVADWMHLEQPDVAAAVEFERALAA